jgi:hypothetical protein
MFAQSVAEYGLLASLSSAVVTLSNAFTDWVREAGPFTYLVAGVILVGVLWSLRRPSSTP